MGRVACTAIAASGDLALVGGVARSHAGRPLGPLVGLEDAGSLYDSVTELCSETEPAVLVDFTAHPVTLGIARDAVERGVAAVVGTTGWTTGERAALARCCERSGVPACIVPNFALGAVLMMRFSEQAARHFPSVEIVELHHHEKRDAPSGTAQLTAERISRARGASGVPIHSVRLRGLVAHQEVLFGGTGELLTIRHDAFSRESFVHGLLLAVRRISGRTGLLIGLDAFLDDPAPPRAQGAR